MTSSPRGSARLGYLDWLRGIGVLIMIEAHTLDSWTRIADRTRPSYRWALVLGGFGAPIFLFLAGVALALAAGSRTRRGMSDAEAGRRATRRGLEVFGLAFLFRLQSLLISGGGLRAFLKVDILNVMGVAMLIAAWLWRVGRSTRGRRLAMAAATLVVAMLTPPVRATHWLDWLPDSIEGYLRPSAGLTTFTIFPWAGFLFGGVLAGMWLDSGDRAREGRRNLALLVVGATGATLAYAASYLPAIYAQTNYWTSSPTFFFVRLGIITALIPVAYGWSLLDFPRPAMAPGQDGVAASWSPIREMGVASLFVYWIHVEMVYGVLSTPLHRALTFEQALVAMVLFSVFLYGLVRLKQRWSSPGVAEKSTKIGSYRAGPASNRTISG